MKNKSKKKKEKFFLKFYCYCFISIFISNIIMWHCTMTIDRMIPKTTTLQEYIYKFFLPVIFLISLIGTQLLIFILKHPFMSLKELLNGIKQLTSGNFSFRIKLGKVMQFKQFTNDFNTMAEKLEEKKILHNDFIYNTSHEFKAPLSAIKGFAMILKNDNLTTTQKHEYLDIIIDESNRLSNLSNNILYLNQIEQKSITSSIENFNLSEQIRRCILLFEHKCSKSHIKLDISIQELSFTGNRELLHQVWVNLLDNAVKFTPPGGKIEIALKRLSDQIIFQIKDNGCGISKENQTYIFNKFYQDDSICFKKGNGLGLTITQKIVTLHHGTISVQSKKGLGTCFTVSFKLD